MKPPLILASASPRRHLLLKKVGIRFTVKPSHVSEESNLSSPRRRVEALAMRKAQATAKTVEQGWILGADTLVVLKNRILGKPINPHDAYRMLYKLSGSRHRVYTGVALVEAGSGRTLVRSEVSTVFMKKLELDVLVRMSKKHLDKAGAYAIQEKHDPIARVTKGSYDNVVGLPVKLVKSMLREFGA
jgi:septum formation protein